MERQFVVLLRVPGRLLGHGLVVGELLERNLMGWELLVGQLLVGQLLVGQLLVLRLLEQRRLGLLKWRTGRRASASLVPSGPSSC